MSIIGEIVRIAQRNSAQVNWHDDGLSPRYKRNFNHKNFLQMPKVLKLMSVYILLYIVNYIDCSIRVY